MSRHSRVVLGQPILGFLEQRTTGSGLLRSNSAMLCVGIGVNAFAGYIREYFVVGTDSTDIYPQ
jgi:hypothetical protein